MSVSIQSIKAQANKAIETRVESIRQSARFGDWTIRQTLYAFKGEKGDSEPRIPTVALYHRRYTRLLFRFKVEKQAERAFQLLDSFIRNNVNCNRADCYRLIQSAFDAMYRNGYDAMVDSDAS